MRPSAYVNRDVDAHWVLWPDSSCGTQLTVLTVSFTVTFSSSCLSPPGWAPTLKGSLFNSRGGDFCSMYDFNQHVSDVCNKWLLWNMTHCSGMPQTHLHQIKILSPGLHRTETRLQVKFFHSILFFLFVYFWWECVESGLMLWLVCRPLSFSQELNQHQRHFPSWKYLSFHNTKEGEIETRLVAEKQFSCWDGSSDDGYLNL